MHYHFFVILLLSAAVGAVAVVGRFRRPSKLAYHAIGMALGFHGLAALAECYVSLRDFYAMSKK